MPEMVQVTPTQVGTTPVIGTAYAPLQTPDVDAIKKSLLKADQPKVTSPEEQALQKSASDLVDQLLTADLGKVMQDGRARQERVNAIDQLGLEDQKRSANNSFLQENVRTLSSKSDDGQEVANALLDLKVKVDELNPNKMKFNDGWAGRTFGWVPGVGKPLNKFVTSFQSSGGVIKSIVESLKAGKEELIRDNKTLLDEQIRMRDVTRKLIHWVRYATVVKAQLEDRAKKYAQDSEERKFIEEELLFPMNQRIIDLQQQQAVNQQGVFVTEIIMRTNKELIRGVDRTCNVTVDALTIAVTMHTALARQKKIFDAKKAVDQTTSELLAGTAAMAKTQAAQINKDASTATLDIELLKQAMSDLTATVEDIRNYRRNALPQMGRTIVELDKLTSEAEQAIQRMEKGNAAQPAIKIELPAQLAA